MPKPSQTPKTLARAVQALWKRLNAFICQKTFKSAFVPTEHGAAQSSEDPGKAEQVHLIGGASRAHLPAYVEDQKCRK